MELYGHGLLPCLPSRIYFLIVTACCASVLPCSVCFDAQYEYCQHTGRTCGNMNFTYPFGVGYRGCGLPSFQIDCVQDSAPAITIQSKKYRILKRYTDSLVIAMGENCQFIDDHTNMKIPSSAYGDTVFNISTSKGNRSLSVYKCDKNHDSGLMQLSKCNASVYWDFYEPVFAGCSQIKKLDVEVARLRWVSIDEKRTENCTSCETSGGICGYSISNSPAAKPFVCYCKDGPLTEKCPGHGKKFKSGITIGASVGVVVLIAAGLVVGITVYRRRKENISFLECFVVKGVGNNKDKDIEAAVHVQDKIGNLPIFSYEVLKKATNDFDEKNRLGDGGFGSVYLGKLPDGRSVAVKRLYQDNSRRVEQFINEVEILSISYHPNLVRLYGCTCPESRDLLLVYEYVPNGTLEDHLHGERKKDKGLNWDMRLKICIETAQALAFLHCLEPPIFHRDVKSPNILLDEDLHVKVADFGLSRFVPLNVTHVSTAPQGTPGYVDPEYYQCFQLTDKSDVYSFGVVLMEIISAKLAVDINRSRKEIVLANMAIAKIQEGALHELIDPNLEIDSNPEVRVMVTAVAKLAFRCLASEKENRPDMKEVVGELEQIKENGRVGKHPAIHPLSPISVHEKWLSTRTTPENSASSVQSSVKGEL